MRSTDLLEYAHKSGKISEGEIKLIRKLVHAESFEGIEDIRDRYESSDFQGHFPQWAKPVEKAYNREREAWTSAAKLIASSPAYELVRSEFGTDQVENRVFNWHESPEQVSISLSEEKKNRDAAAVDDKLGKAGDLASLAEMFPQHVKAKKGYSEQGDGGWAGGGPDSWSEWTDYVPLTDAGRIAMEKVKAGARPAEAVSQAIAENSKKLEEKRRSVEDAEAAVKHDMDERKRRESEERTAYELLNVRPKSGSGRTPWFRRSPERWQEDIEDYTRCLQSVQSVPSLNEQIVGRRDQAASEYSKKIDHCRAELEKAIRLISILENAENASAEELSELQSSGFLIGKEEKRKIEMLIEERQEVKAEVKTPPLSEGAWGALDNFKR